jgi:predicted TIM-barrel fold metal-dependent hydrolase
VGIETLLVDTGYPSEYFSDYSVPLDTFSAMVHCRVHEIFRIENLVMELLNMNIKLDEAVEEFNHTIDSKVKEGIVALKSVIAYRTGLSIRKRTEDDVEKAYRTIMNSLCKGVKMQEVRNVTPEIKMVFDYFLFNTVGICLKHDLPLQVHVGMGDIPGIDLRTSNPLLLKEFISDPEVLKVKIVFTHAGYPFLREAGFLAASYPNVYIDFSETVPFSSVGASNMLMSLFEMTPVTKIMYGSDCFNIPELAWISALITKKELGSTLCNLQGKWSLDEDWAVDAATNILSGNAERVYKLPE